ncbi:hypothetical protein SAMN05192541_14515 [Bradyrhizobium arachidis]|nr:hypothetical protein SAMN05192541_14515 [Bradyrhizobium arachidis]
MGMARNVARALREPPRKSEAMMEASCGIRVVQWPILRRDSQIREARRAFRRHPRHLLRLRSLGPACSRPPLS